MSEYHVISDFIDRETGDIIRAGSIFEADEDRAEGLRAAGVIGKEVKVEHKKDDDDEVLDDERLTHLGGGYYELPNGEKVRGKKKAIEALAELDSKKDEVPTKEPNDPEIPKEPEPTPEPTPDPIPAPPEE